MYIFKFSGESDDWSKLTKVISPGNLASLGNPSKTTIADCLGDNIRIQYQVRKLVTIPTSRFHQEYELNFKS